jgi:1,4-alpha-glucan branching enzyme
MSFYRQTTDGSDQVVVILNLTPVPREHYRVGLPRGGFWREVLNSDAGIYGGSNKGNLGGVHANGPKCHGQPHSAEFFLPPMGVTVFRNEK